MGESQNYFQNLEPLFRKYALPDIRKSQEYQHAANNLMDILLLADRVLAASVETVEAGRVKNIADKLSKVQLSQDVSSHTGDDLLRDAELWLKGVLFLIDPISYMEKKDKKYFTLYSLLRDLDLLSQAETEKGINTYGEITDTIRQKILLAYRYRNPLTHNPQDYPETIKSNFFTFALIIFIAPIIKYQDEISEKLKGLVSSQLPSNTPEVIDLLRLFEGERRKHLEIFGGRNPQLDEIQKRLEGDLRERGAYLLLTGLEGIGKSAFCAQLINNLTQAISPIGRYGEEVRKYASWLPGIIFHSGKQSKVPLEIAKSIITQANTMLLEPVEINFKKRETDVSGFEHSLNYRQDNKFRGIQNSTLSYATHSELPNPLLIQPENKSQLPLLEEIRRKIYAILEKVVQEYGNVILIIDALDEISTFGKDLIFLPETLPPGASALLTTRDNTKASQFIAQYCDNYKVRLNKLKEDEISFIVKSDSADPKELALLHKKTWEKSRGWPIIVADAARKAKFTKKLGEIDIDKTPYELFERQAREWTEASQKEILYHVLLLLAIFEPACPLELSLVQGFLLHTQFHLTQSEIRYLLHPVAHQVEGLDEGQIKLAFKAFAEHIRNAYLSPKDTRNFLGRITVWLKEEEDLDAKTTGLFLSYWADATQVKDQRIQAIIENFNEHVRASMFRLR